MRKYSFPTIVVLFLVIVSVGFAQQPAASPDRPPDQPFKILEKPVPALPYNHNTLDITGTVKLKIEFLSTGDIGGIEPVSELPPELTQNAVDAAKKIKFQPEIRDGVILGTTRIVEYPYSWNGGWKLDNAPQPEKNTSPQVEKAEAIIKRAIEKMGGEKYLQVRTVYGKGTFSAFKDGLSNDFSNFTDIIVFPNKERTEFKNGGYKTVQVNTGDTGWIFGEDTRSINDQVKNQIDDFKRSLRVSIDNLLRGGWRNDGAKLSYAGRREAGLGQRNEVIRITFNEDIWVEFEFSSTTGLPAKSVYELKNADHETGLEEDRYAQFVNVQGVMAPYIIDHFREKKQVSRINYQSVEFNKSIPQSAFDKPSDLKEAKKDIKM